MTGIQLSMQEDDANLSRGPFLEQPICMYHGHSADVLDLSWSKVNNVFMHMEFCIELRVCVCVCVCVCECVCCAVLLCRISFYFHLPWIKQSGTCLYNMYCEVPCMIL